LLSYTRFSQDGLCHLEGLGNLRRLDLVRTRLKDAGLQTIGRFKKLASLNLDYTDVTDKGLRHLQGLSELRHLSLDSALVTDQGLPYLLNFPKLRSLNIYHTLISEEGYQQLKARYPDCEIIWDRDSALPNRRRS
jgi:hypothetical protein